MVSCLSLAGQCAVWESVLNLVYQDLVLNTWGVPEVLDIPGDQSGEPGVGLQAIKQRLLASP